MKRFEALERLASMLRLSQQSGGRPYTLLLTSSVSFTPEVYQYICDSVHWDDFQRYVQGLGAGEYMDTLKYALRQNQHLSGYQALARLIKEGYFSLILTCNLDSQLEDALLEIGCEVQVLVIGGHSEEYIASSLENPPEGVYLLKLHGCIKKRILPAAFPHFWQFPPNLQAALKRHLNRDMLVIGSIAHDQDVVRSLARNVNNSLYYVLPETPDPYDEIVTTIEARGKTQSLYLINGRYGEFNNFFGQLMKNLSVQPFLTITDYSQDQPVGQRADILLVTVTKTETDAVLEFFPDKKIWHYADQTYFDLGFVQRARVFLVQQSTMGSSTVGGSILTVYKGIQTLEPATIIMVGIAYGFDQQRYALGDILVSEQVQMYEYQRVGSGEQREPVFLLRGSRPSTSPRLLSRFRSSLQSWQGQKVEFGLIVSGEKVIDHEGYRDQIRRLVPEALGGEMEGGGLYAATQDHSSRVDWILVKAICDWADGNKGLNKQQNQQKAAYNAAWFVVHVLRQGGFAPEERS